MPIRARKRKSGKVVFDVRAEYSGVRLQRTVPITMTEAKRVESKMLQDLINGRFDILKNKKNPKFRDYAQEYKRNVLWQKSHNRTCESLKPLVAFFGNKMLSEITMSDFIRYRTERLEKVKKSIINREHACIKRMLNIAVQSDDYLLRKNAVSKIKLFKETPAEDRTLTVSEYHKLLEVASEYLRRVIFFACNTAMRREEILSMRLGQIKVWPSGIEVELTETKSGDKETVPLNQDTIDLIFEIANEKGINLKNMSQKDKTEYVFTGRYGKRIKDLRRQMQVTFEKAGIEYRSFHTFRNFWTSEMFDAGVDVGKIRKIGRWKDLKTMLRYCHSNKSQEHDAVNALSIHLKKPQAKVLKLNQAR